MERARVEIPTSKDLFHKTPVERVQGCKSGEATRLSATCT